MMEQQKHLMKCVLDDTQLNRLRLEGGTVLARIRKEEACENENYRYGSGGSGNDEGHCAFTVRAPRLWNALPGEIKRVESVPHFQSLLKTHMY